ncbi:PQQ-binding-like beta-propeller repeat protein [Armatimonas rosea]|uniref:Ig-like domain-containing protein n=1 Tax=Armatimonas rosea TaxID=685828 RepID=A0A7W9SR38_ARMRO|nr:PQQ-binding-like beta-propeller repeat protein [Armatimonas rosea]MBB6050905.1 hypothetical protein [Armatimonas rosea]
MPDDRSLSRRVFVMGSLGSALAAGCGAGTTPTGAPTSTSRGAATFTILWPEPKPASRLIPVAAKSITVKMVGPETVQKTVARPPAGTTQTDVTFDSIEVGSYTVTATAYPSASGAGVAQASGTLNLNVVKNQTASDSLTLGTTIKTIELSPNPVNLGVGQERTIVAIPRDQAGTIVLTQSSWSWSSSQTSVCSVSGSSSTAVVKGNSLGTTEITVLETESSLSQTVPLSVVASPTEPALSSWPQSRCKPSNSGQGGGSNNQGQLKWKYKMRAAIYTEPVIQKNGNILTADWSGWVYSFTKNGDLAWEKQILSLQYGPACGLDGTIYLPNGWVYAIDETGSLKWTFSESGFEGAGINVDKNGILYMASSSNLSQKYLVAINPNGTLRWKQPITGSCYGSPAIDSKGNIYVTTYFRDPFGPPINETGLYSFTPDGVLRWSKQITSRHTPVIGIDDTVYVWSVDGLFAAFTPAGALKWTYYYGDGDRSTEFIVTNQNNLIFGYLRKIGSNGAPIWTTDISGPGIAPFDNLYRSSPVCDINENTYLCSNTGMHCVAPDGSIRWVFDSASIHGSRGSMFGRPAIDSDGTIYSHSVNYDYYFCAIS